MIKKYKNYKIELLFLIIGFFVFGVNITRAEENLVNPDFFINLDAATIAKGYTVTAFNNQIKLSLVPGILDESTGVDVMILNEKHELPWNVNKISSIYQFEFRNKAAYDDHHPFYIQMSYDQDDDTYKQVFFYDKNYNTWRPLPTRDYPDENFVRSLIHLPFARIAVFSYPNTLTNGRASWYAFRGGNFAASPDYPKGSVIRVHNKNNGKYVDVKINDYGPDRSLFPDRVIDLDKNAFLKIASLKSGVIDVNLEPLSIVPDEKGRIMGVSDKGASTDLDIDALAGVIMEEDTGEVLWAKEEKKALPLASLTKMVAMKIFLDTDPIIEKMVKYSVEDKEHNYEYCERKYSVASLDLEDGEEISIKDLIYSSIISSTNNTVETLVRVSGVSRDRFIENMNDFATSIGASSTVFLDPTGLSPDNMSTAQDYAIIMREVLKNNLISSISILKEHKFSTGENNSHTIRNTNHLVRYGLVNDITASKTGYLIEAGYCLMTRIADHSGKNLIAVTLGAADRDTSFSDMRELISYGLNMYNKELNS